MSIEEGSTPRSSRPVEGESGTETARPAEAAAKSSGRALIRLAPEERKSARARFALNPSQGMIAAAVALVLGGGFVAGAQMLGGKAAPTVAAAQSGPPPETTASLLHRVEDEVHTLKVSVDSIRSNAENARQDDAIRSLKRSVDVLKQDLEVAKASNAGATAQLGAKLDRLDRDPTPKLAEISTRLDRLEREPNSKLAEIAARLEQIKGDPSSPKLADISARLDRIEHQISSPTATGSIAQPARSAAANTSVAPVTRTPPLPPPAPAPVSMADAEPKPAPKPAPVDGWMLRDVYGGVALLEGRTGGLREVAPGQFVPGIGEIRSIERRGRSWVVITSRGIIEADSRW